MNQEIKDEALEQLELDIKFGFDDEEMIFEGILEMFYDEENLDEDWLREAISEKYRNHQQESLTWPRPTHFEKIAAAFDELIAQKIVCLHKAGYTKQDAQGDCKEVVEQLDAASVKAIGFCFYHEQDLERVVETDGGGLYLGFDSVTQNNGEAVLVARKIIDAVVKQGFEVSWDGTVDQRIEVKNVRWQKVPDKEEWGGERVMQMLANGEPGKPFWKVE